MSLRLLVYSGCSLQLDASLSARITLRISGAAHSTQTTMRNSLRGLRCMRLLDGLLPSAV